MRSCLAIRNIERVLLLNSAASFLHQGMISSCLSHFLTSALRVLYHIQGPCLPELPRLQGAGSWGSALRNRLHLCNNAVDAALPFSHSHSLKAYVNLALEHTQPLYRCCTKISSQNKRHHQSLPKLRLLRAPAPTTKHSTALSHHVHIHAASFVPPTQTRRSSSPAGSSRQDKYQSSSASSLCSTTAEASSLKSNPLRKHPIYTTPCVNTFAECRSHRRQSSVCGQVVTRTQISLQVPSRSYHRASLS